MSGARILSLVLYSFLAVLVLCSFILDLQKDFTVHIPQAIDEGFESSQCLAAVGATAFACQFRDRGYTAVQFLHRVIGGVDQDRLAP